MFLFDAPGSSLDDASIFSEASRTTLRC